MARRVLESAALAAAVLAGALVELTLYLNPTLTLRHEILALGLCLFLPWWLGAALALALVAFAATALRWWPRPYRPVVEGQPFFASLAFLALGVVAAAFAYNLIAYRHAIPLPSLGALAVSTAVIVGAWLVLLAVGLDVLLFPRRERPLAAALAVLAPAAALAVPLALRPRPVPPSSPIPVTLDAVTPPRRVVLVGVDGMGPAWLERRAPSLALLAQRGAFGPLASIRPTEGPPVWTTIATGRLPRDHGVKSLVSYRLRGSSSDWALLPKGVFVGYLERAGLLTRLPVASGQRTRRALWNVANAFGIPAGLVRIWGTHPPEKIQGFVLSPYFHVLAGDRSRAAEALHPPDLLEEVRARVVGASDLEATLLGELAEGPTAVGSPLDDPALRRLAERGLAPDLTYERAGVVLKAAYDPQFFALAFHGFDAAGHTFFRFAEPERFGDVEPQDARRYGRVLDHYSALLGRWVGELAQGLQPGDVLVIVSGWGFEPTPLWRRLLGVLTGTEVAAASHVRAPDGLILVVGDAIRPGARIRGASVLDVAPTLLYLMGLPVARDMEGRVLTEMLDDAFARAHPVTFIPSYESLAVTPAAPAAPLDELPPLPEEGP